MADVVTTPLSTGVTPAAATGVSPYTNTGTVSAWAQPYVADMLSTGSDLANQAYTPYSGQLVAGQTADQTNAFSGIGSLTAPSGAYDETQFTNQYRAPSLTNATNFTNQYSAIPGYNATNFTTDTWDTADAQKYMNPYLQTSLSPQLDEARRQSQITQTQNAAKATQAGAYGGSRQALMDTETQRNLATTQSGIMGTGYKNAYDTALQQWNTEQGRSLDAQKATEAANQYGYGQKMTAAQLQAQYGMSAQQAQEAARQFQTTQGMTAAQLQAQYGMSAQQAQEAANQFGANYGLQSLGAAETLYGKQAELGAQQRGIAQEGLTSAYQQWQNQQKYPYEQLQFQQSLLSGLPLTTSSVSAPELTTAQKIGAVGTAATSALTWAKNAGLVGQDATLKTLIDSGYSWVTKLFTDAAASGGLDTSATGPGSYSGFDLSSLMDAYGATPSTTDAPSLTPESNPDAFRDWLLGTGSYGNDTAPLDQGDNGTMP